MNTLIPGLGKSGKARRVRRLVVLRAHGPGQMSSSEPLSKVDLHDSPETIANKMRLAFSEDGKPEGNGLLAMLKYILLRPGNPPLHMDGRTWTYDEVHAAFTAGTLGSDKLKPAVAARLTAFLEPVRKWCEENRHLYAAAYPEAAAAEAAATQVKPLALGTRSGSPGLRRCRSLRCGCASRAWRQWSRTPQPPPSTWWCSLRRPAAQTTPPWWPRV